MNVVKQQIHSKNVHHESFYDIQVAQLMFHGKHNTPIRALRR